DSGLIWIEGVAATVPTGTAWAETSPYVLREEDQGFGIWRDGARLAAATAGHRPRFYDLTTADGVPYWKIALLHLDSLASAGLPVEVQFEPPDDLDVIDRVADMGIDSVGIHVESFDPAVLARIAPAKARTGIDGYFAAWERAVACFGEGQVSTYVILGMGEDPDVTVEGCRRAIDIGVYPFVVPLRPIAGSLLEDRLPPSAEYTERIYRRVLPYLQARGIGASSASAGCARCQACSALGALERQSAEPAPRRLIPVSV